MVITFIGFIVGGFGLGAWVTERASRRFIERCLDLIGALVKENELLRAQLVAADVDSSRSVANDVVDDVADDVADVDVDVIMEKK